MTIVLVMRMIGWFGRFQGDGRVADDAMEKSARP